MVKNIANICPTSKAIFLGPIKIEGTGTFVLPLFLFDSPDFCPTSQHPYFHKNGSERKYEVGQMFALRRNIEENRHPSKNCPTS